MATTATKPANGQGQLTKYNAGGALSLVELGAYFGDNLERIRNSLPPTMKKHAERLVRVALNEIQKNAAIAKCTGFSILKCVLEASTMGLEIGGPLGQSYMIPYGSNAQFQIGYRGLIALAYRSGAVANIYAQVVREKDRFRILAGTTPGIDHEPVPAGGGSVIGAYAVIVYKSGQINFEYMTRDEIEHHRKTYSKQPKSILWTSAWNEGAKKTVVRKLLKYAPLGIEFPTDDDDEVVETATVETPREQLPASDNTPDEEKGENDGRLPFEGETDISALAR